MGASDLPSKFAHSIQEMRMCEAFVSSGEDVRYLHGHTVGEDPKITWDDISDHYGLQTRFEIRTFRNLYQKTGRFTKLGTISMAGPMAAYVFLEHLAGRLGPEDVVYGRNYYPLYFLAELFRYVPSDERPPVVYEFHNPIDKRFEERFFALIDGIVCITEKLARYTTDTYDVDRDRILVAPDGVDPSPYAGLDTKSVRDRLGMSDDENIVMYTGHCYPGKGVETLVRAADGLDASVYVVGGYQDDIDRIKETVGTPENVTFTGFVEPADIPSYQVAADVLVAPYDEQARAHVSPLKLFEYMAAGKPIVASDLEVLQEVLNDGENALLFDRGDAASLREKLREVLASPSLRTSLSEPHERAVETFRWSTRAEAILEWIRASLP